MAEMTAAEVARPATTARFNWTRLASFLSIFPLGIWTVNHVWDNLAAYTGAEAWQAAVTEHPHPVAHWLTLTVVLLPLVLHTIWGIQRLLSTRPNNQRYGYYTNLKYALQRLTAIGAVGFLGAHIYLAMLKPRLMLGRPEAFADLAREMHHHTPTLVVYLLGTLAMAFHLANGVNGFAWTWGLTAGRASMRWLDRVVILFFVVLVALSWGVIYALYRAGA